MFLAHKISYTKWEKYLNLPVDDIPADAITADLRTHENTLSFWNCGDHQPAEEALDAAALAVSTDMDKASKVYLVYLEKESLETHGYRIEHTDGKTKIAGMNHLHYDICDLNFRLLGDMAKRVQQAILNGQMHQVARADLLGMLANAVNEGRLDTADLKKKLKSEVESRLNQQAARS